MKEINKYNPDDIEQLLSTKSFEELSSGEKEFAMTQIDSEQEYQELRNTLLSINLTPESQLLVCGSPLLFWKSF